MKNPKIHPMKDIKISDSNNNEMFSEKLNIHNLEEKVTLEKMTLKI